jgi:hypothetical protein
MEEQLLCDSLLTESWRSTSTSCEEESGLDPGGRAFCRRPALTRARAPCLWMLYATTTPEGCGRSERGDSSSSSIFELGCARTTSLQTTGIMVVLRCRWQWRSFTKMYNRPQRPFPVLFALGSAQQREPEFGVKRAALHLCTASLALWKHNSCSIALFAYLE